MAGLIKGYHVRWAPYSSSKPTTWTELSNCIRALPNFFPDPDTVDTTTVDNVTPTSIPGMSAGEAYGFTVAPNKEFLDAHAEMVTEQLDDSKGSFWMQIDMTNRGQRIEGQFTTVEYLPTPEGNAGELDEITWNVYASSDLSVTPITSSPTV